MGLRLINHNSSQCRYLLSEAGQKHCWNQWIREKNILMHSWMLANDWNFNVYLVRLCLGKRGREKDMLALLCEQGSEVCISWKPCINKRKATLPKLRKARQNGSVLFGGCCQSQNHEAELWWQQYRALCQYLRSIKHIPKPRSCDSLPDVFLGK